MYIIVVDNNARYVYGGSWCASPNDCTVKHTIFIFFHLGYMRGSCKVILKKVSDPLWQTHLLSPHPRKFSKSAHVLYSNGAIETYKGPLNYYMFVSKLLHFLSLKSIIKRNLFSRFLMEVSIGNKCDYYVDMLSN